MATFRHEHEFQEYLGELIFTCRRRSQWGVTLQTGGSSIQIIVGYLFFGLIPTIPVWLVAEEQGGPGAVFRDPAWGTAVLGTYLGVTVLMIFVTLLACRTVARRWRFDLHQRGIRYGRIAVLFSDLDRVTLGRRMSAAEGVLSTVADVMVAFGKLRVNALRLETELSLTLILNNGTTRVLTSPAIHFEADDAIELLNRIAADRPALFT